VGRTPDHYCEVKRTFYFYRAAWIYGVAQELAQSIEEFAHAHDAVDGEAVKEMTDRLLALSVDMMRHAPGVAGGQGRPGDEAQSEGDFARLRGGKRAVPAKSKRSGLGKLPDDWREQVIDASKSASCTFWPAIAVLAATGCRSAEIGLGVRVFVQDEHGLRILIPGAKVRAGIAGQPLRELLFPNAGEVPGGSELQSLARAHGGRVDIRTPSVQALRNAVRTFGAPVGADHDYKISTMSFRHAFASDAKCSGEREGLPAAMGQRSDRTMRTYGTAAHGRRRLKFISSATHEVKRTAGNALPKTRKGPMPS
jgi:integrase